ncbi:MAG: hypothetical protein HY788_16425 [Deltaproteobacteria bacterium]|nr:hypothetical protein [Deltaproteobacteria bacterium]
MIRKVMKLLSERTDLGKLDALDPFAREGDWHTRYWSSLVRSLTLWEILPQHEKALRRNFPEAVVKITDSYQEVKRTDQRFDLIVLDNDMTRTDHIEHFDLFPEIYRTLNRGPVYIVRNVIENPSLHRGWAAEEVKEARKRFYGHGSEVVPIPVMARTYARLAEENGFQITWSCIAPRNEAICYYAEELVRIARPC